MRRRDEYGKLTGLLSSWLEHLRLRQALKHIPHGCSILEIGCGRAEVLRFRQPARYVGLDIIPELIDRNRSRYPRYDFALVNVEKQDMVLLGKFDVVLMLAVIEHFAKPEQVLKKVKGLLAAGGLIIATTPHPSGECVLQVGSRLGLCSSESLKEHHSLLAREELHRLAGRCGFRVSLYRTFLLGLNQLAILRE